MESRLSEYLLDSDVLIQHLRGHGATTDLLTRSTLNGPLGIAAICRTEVIAGMRDKIIHGYRRIDLQEVWNTATKDIPILITQLEPLVSAEEEDET